MFELNPLVYRLNCKIVIQIRSPILHLVFQEESTRLPRKEV